MDFDLDDPNDASDSFDTLAFGNLLNMEALMAIVASVTDAGAGEEVTINLDVDFDATTPDAQIIIDNIGTADNTINSIGDLVAAGVTIEFA